ncbi:MAG: FAD-binding protein [Pseudonocardiaceae bacterium]|nr:FAD-binding protein [Pseudonocardiaceae bacterium]
MTRSGTAPSWSGWGDPALVPTLPEPVVTLLGQALGVTPPRAAPVAMADVSLPEPDLPGGCRDELVALLGAEQVRDDRESRIRHTRGKSTPDLVRLRGGDAGDAPDLVVLPGSHDEVAAVLRSCAQHRVAVVPFGGGTSVVGGLTARRAGLRGVLALDLARMNRLLAVDAESRTATLQPGLLAPQAEELLGAHGFTLGHFPQSFEYASIGGFAATRSAGQASAGYGRFDEMVVGLTVATPQGSLELGRAPASAAGPDLRQLILGSEGALGVVTAVTVRVAAAPERRIYDGWRFGSFPDGMAALRRLAQDGPRPTVLRLSDETETAVGLARPGRLGSAPSDGCLVIAGYEGAPTDVTARRDAASAELAGCGGEPLGAEVGQAWQRQRYAGPYLRDALLDAGAFAETLETATFWSGMGELYEAVRTALTEELTAQGTPPLVACHVSHVYATGASLYFTVACAQACDPLAQWQRAKTAAGDAILAAGATITHHHGVGADHREHYAREVGPLAVDVLRAVKDRLDPAGILNPGVLVG